MRRRIVLLTTMAMMLLAATSVAMAATITCIGGATGCVGTNSDDTMNGDGTGQFMRALNGNDTMLGKGGSDEMYGEDGSDKVYGEDGNDYISGWNGDDYMSGGNGSDHLYGGTGNDLMNGNSGSDHLYGGTGNDTYYDSAYVDWYEDQSSYSNDTYFGLSQNCLCHKVARDGGGSDLLDLSTLDIKEVRIGWLDTEDADGNRDSLVVWHNRDSMYFYNYFDNKGGTGPGVGAIEAIKYKNVRDHRFPFPETQ